MVALAEGLRESHMENAEGGPCDCSVYLDFRAFCFLRIFVKGG